MGCVKLLNGLDISCQDFVNKYYQQVVLINRSDVNEVVIKNSDDFHRISFNLNAGASGFLFAGNEAGDVYKANFDKETENGIPLYGHSVELPVVGTAEHIKILLKQLDAADMFAAVQFKDGTVEIYGFENGLATQDYTYEAQSGTGGAVIELTSKHQEYSPPYVYFASGNETAHFNALFAGLPAVIGGDFNNDFSNDFDNRVV